MADTHRIAALVPSASDLVEALGFGAALVGVSHECDARAAEGLPVLTSSGLSKVQEVGPAQVDREVTEAVASGESLYVTDRALLAELRPTVVVSQDVCDVCAVSAGQVRHVVPEGATLVMLQAQSLAGLAADVRALAAALGAEARGERVVAELEARLEAVRTRAQERAGPRPRVLALEWGEPAFTGGHWVPELIALAGGQALLTGPGEPSRRATWDEVRAADPDVVVHMPCGYTLDEAAEDARRLRGGGEALHGVRAVDSGRLWATDATRLFSRCTPQAMGAAAEVLARVLAGDDGDGARRVA